MECSLPLHSSGGYTFQSDVQRRAFFAWLKETGRYIPNYSGPGRRGGRRTSSSGYSLPDYSRIKGRRRTRASPASSNPAYSAAKAVISAANPAAGAAITAGETVYIGYREVSAAVADCKRIWESKDQAGKKLTDMADRVAEAGTNVSKAAANQVISSVSGDMASLLVGSGDRGGGFDPVEKATGIQGIGGACKDLLTSIAAAEIQRRLAQ